MSDFILVDVNISAEKYKLMYQGIAQHIDARALDGRRVRFPANILRPFLLRDGIKGRFRILYDKQGKYQKIERVQVKN